MDVLKAAERVGYPGARFEGWDTELELPENAEELMEYCGVAAADRGEMLAARPDPDRDPEWWAITSAMAGEIEQELGRPIPPTGFRGWPAVPQNTSAVGLFAAAWALLASLPKLRELHANRGVPESATVATVSALGGVMQTHRHLFGWYPEEPIAGLVCRSWLLDPQLAEYLRPDSNIIRFQSRFDLLPLLPPEDPTEGDRELMRLGLHLPVPPHPLTQEDLATVPQDTTLRRAFVSHLRDGRHWYPRTGMLKAWS